MKPEFLKKGDTIGVVAPARKIAAAEIQLAVDTLKSWGLNVIFGSHLFRSYHQFSGTDEERAQDLQRMLDDPAVKAIISARGGYGTLRIIDRLDFTGFMRNPKWIIGYSDLTVLHAHLHNLGWTSLHAPMLIDFFKNAEATDSIRRFLFGEKVSYQAASHPLNRQGKAEGILTGGNLSLLYAIAGSRSDIDTKGKILFLEDLDEYLYHIDRMMMNLERSGKLAHLAGLVVGSMTAMKDNLIPFGKSAEEIIAQAVSKYDYPVCYGFPAGHAEKNLALPFGERAKLDIADLAALSF
ncbi:MAG: LD-carboxypeptidase [Bacteroidota bacterium]